MSEIRTYNDLVIYVLRCTYDPHLLVAEACNTTQKRDVNGFLDVGSDRIPKLIKYLVTANHTSPLEHAVITVRIEGMSRSLLAQLTRHRMGSFTASSQHYQQYEEYSHVIHPDMVTLEGVADFLKRADNMYNYCIESGIPKEEARQVLPNAKAVNLMWTVNARSLVNFFNQRLCRRNVKEMLQFAIQLHTTCYEWFPELFKHVGPDCEMLGGCTQGHMKANYCKENDVPNFSQ